MKVKDCVSNLVLTIPDEFAVSNEVWPTETLDALRGVEGDAAAVIGSGNAPNILPILDKIERVSFMDIASGHGKVFRAKLNAARSTGSLACSLGTDFAAALLSEASLFDMTRVAKDKRHFTVNDESARAFSALPDDLMIADHSLNILDESKAQLVNPDAKRLAWLHLSNVVPYCVERGAKDVEKKLFGFIDDLAGVDDDTMVTYSKRADVPFEDLKIRRLVVATKRLDELVFSDFLNQDTIHFDSSGQVVRRAIA